MEAQQQALDSLKKRVMQVPRDALPRCESLVHSSAPLASHLPDAHTTCRIAQTSEAQKADCFEPRCLIVGRRHAERQARSNFVPKSGIITSDHPKAIRPGREAGVEGLPSGSGFLPILVAPFEFIPKA